jgi:hypothetical protein
MRIVLVGPNHGVGPDSTNTDDRTLHYKGQHLRVILAKKR